MATGSKKGGGGQRKAGAQQRQITASWKKLLSRIPGYDPIATAQDQYFDAKKAQHVLDFFTTCLKHVKGELAGEPFLLMPWQQSILANMFGWLNPDGTRRYREVLLFVPRKQGKSFLAAGIVLYVLFCDGEFGSEIYGAAAEKEQATLIFQHVKGMILQEEEFLTRCKIYDAAKSVVIEATNSSYKVLASGAPAKHGFNSNLIIIDELHAQPNRELVDVLMTSTGSRRQPLVIHVTTSDFQRPSICNEKHDYARKVRDRIIDDASFLPIIYEAPIDADWTNEKVWAAANPCLGHSLSLDYMRRECQRALQTPSYQNTFKRLHLNMQTAQDVCWIDIAAWDACYDTKVHRDKLTSRVCFAGLDLATVSDLCALELYFPEEKAILSYFWIPEETADLRLERSRVPYPAWIQQGYITATEGNVTDYDIIRRDINRLCEHFHIKELAIDRWNSTQLQTQLLGDGIDVIPFGQGFSSMSAPTKELERLILSRELRHDGNPVLRWCMNNVMIETDAGGNIKPSKQKSSEKIDGCVALIMAIGRAIVQPDIPPSVYETRGLLRV